MLLKATESSPISSLLFCDTRREKSPAAIPVADVVSCLIGRVITLLRTRPRTTATKTAARIASHKELRNPSLEGVGFGDDGFEKEWAACVMDSIFKKTEDFKRPEFIKYDENILLIFEDHVPIRNVDIAMKYLNQKLEEYWCKNICFDKILIDCNKGCMIEIDCSDRGYQVFDIKGKV